MSLKDTHDYSRDQIHNK